MKIRGNRYNITWEQAGDILKVRGVLLTTGEFVGLNGRPTKFTPESLLRLYENIAGNIPFKLTHLSDEKIGYATKFGINDDCTELWYEGYVFDQRAMEKIMEMGYDGVSAEILTELSENDTVEDGVITAIAFTPYPAVDEAGIEEAMPVALSKSGGENHMELKEVKEEFDLITKVRELLIQGEVPEEVIESIIKVLKGEAKVYPYPYPYPEPKLEEYQTKLSEAEQRIKELETQLSEYSEMINEIKSNELSSLIEELKNLGFSSPESIVDNIEDIDTKIAVLQKVKEEIALTKASSEPAPETSTSNMIVEELAKDFGLTVDEFKEIFGGEFE